MIKDNGSNYLVDIAASIKDKYYKRELEFRGFIRLENYKMRPRWAYVLTNRKIDGSIWVYPQKLMDNYSLSKKGKPHYQGVFERIALPGITKIKYSW